MFRFDGKSFDPDVQPYFKGYWEYERYEADPVIEPLPAVGVMHLEFIVGNPLKGVIDGKAMESSKLVFAGMLPTAGNYICPHGYYLIYGVTITPLGLWRLFGLRSADCLNGFMNYHEVTNEPYPDLVSTPPGIKGQALRFKMVNDWCLKLLSSKNQPWAKIERLAHNLAESRGAAKVLSLIEEGSPRQLQRTFKDLAGISPKHYACILRFNATLALLATKPNISLLEVALTTGYNDASHLCHDFKKLGHQLPME